ncbi:MAG: RagB/SusD family nutrient uptake outer membrane protein [Microscillaceae bacterium]|jgi:hypothetical protein|nr:RagB/SusD family nutrient uptake outer membrane protein [Microscillaceae bacterium]
MKKYVLKLRVLMPLIFLLTIGCTDLEVDETDSVVVNTTGGNATTNVADLLASAYTDLGAFTDQANIYSLFQHVSDEMIPPTRGTDWGDNGVWRTLHAHNWDATHQFVRDSWNQLNQRAFKAVRILASSPTPAQAAEARFLRAFYMWNIMDLYGKVPYREANEGVEVNPRVLTRQEALNFIIADLEAALAGLPATAPTNPNPKATKAAANALLARVYLNKAVYTQPLENAAGPYTFNNADMDKVISYADAIAADGYALEDEYFKPFTNTANTDVILTSPEGSPENRWRMTLHYNNNPDGWNGFATLSEFYAKFDNNDERKSAPSPRALGQTFHGIKKGFLVGSQLNDNGQPITNTRQGIPLSFSPDVALAGAKTDAGIRVIKYHPADAGKYIILRYADVYLMKAEALFRKGSTAEAKTLIDNLRALRGLGALPGALTLQNILDERGRELYWEGIRRVDQVRFGTFDDVWQEKASTDSRRVLFPIPQQAMDSNPNLTQNPGY